MSKMIDFKIISRNDYKLVPWKNGKGTTTELIAVYLENSDDFIWRISMAGVINNEDFSDFSGYDRYLILLDGEGMLLDHGNGKISELYNIYDIAHFSGSWKTRAKLNNGPIKDFNVMTDENYCYAEIDILITDRTCDINIDSDNLLVFSPTGNVSVTQSNKTDILNHRDLLHIYNSKNCKIQIKGDIVFVIKIYIQPHYKIFSKYD